MSSRIVNRSNSPVQLDLLGAEGGVEQITLEYGGRGYAQLFFDHRPGSGLVLETDKLEVVDSSAGSTVAVSAGPENLLLEEIVFDGSLAEFVFAGDVDQLRAAAGSGGTINHVEVGTVRAVHALDYFFQDFYAESMGDADTDMSFFDAAGLSSLMVAQDISNVTFLDPNSTNALFSQNKYRDVEVGGIVTGSGFYGSGINEFVVANEADEEIALGDSFLWFNAKGATIDAVSVQRGDVESCTFLAEKNLEYFEVADGNFVASTVASVNKIEFVYIAGDVDAESQLQASDRLGSRIRKVICGGEFAGTVSVTRVDNVMVGFDGQGRRRAENDEFRGSDLTGTISSILSIGDVNVTGAIRNATLSLSNRSLNSILAEDGLEDVTISFPRKVKLIMVGYLNGNPRMIVNPEANVSGSINARALGKMYYTGELDDNLRLPARVGWIEDGIPDP